MGVPRQNLPGHMQMAPGQTAPGQMMSAHVMSGQTQTPGQAAMAKLFQPLEEQPPIAKGQIVMIQGLRSRADLNGQRAKVLSGGGSEGRWDCELTSARGLFITVKEEILVVISTAGVEADTERVRISPKRKRKSRSRSKKRRRSSSSCSSSSSSSGKKKKKKKSKKKKKKSDKKRESSRSSAK